MQSVVDEEEKRREKDERKKIGNGKGIHECERDCVHGTPRDVVVVSMGWSSSTQGLKVRCVQRGFWARRRRDEELRDTDIVVRNDM